MKILAINGSPRGAQGNTDVLIQAFLNGARAEGATTEVVYVADLDIHPCIGCFACWTRTPGVCIHKDDMPEMLQRVRQADILVLATPLYGNMVTGILKNFIDRMLPLSNPAIEKIGSEYVHPARYDDGVFRFVVISNAGFPETHHFDGLRATFSQMESGPRAGCAGMICCAAGPMLTTPGMHDRVQWYLDATIAAGREVVRDGRITPETQSILDHSLAEDPAAYAGTINAYWQSVGVNLADSNDRPGVDEATHPVRIEPGVDDGSVRGLVSRLSNASLPETANELSAVIQFDIKDEDPGQYYLEIDTGRCTAYEGRHSAPSLTIHSPAQVWLNVCTGKLDGAAAYMSGQYQVTGDLSLLMQFGSLFAEA